MAVSPTVVPCFVDAPHPLRDGLLYALRTLLRPLGCKLDVRDTLPEEGPLLYYGPGSVPLPPRTVELHRGPEVTAFFGADEQRRAEDVVWVDWDGEQWPILFGDERAPDLLASAFYWLSGWQEHVDPARDEHGRYPVDASLQTALDVVRRPPVDAYRGMLAEHLASAGIEGERRTWEGRRWAFCPTIDVDYVRKWRLGIIYRETVQYLLLNQRQVPIGERLRRFGASARDAITPGDPYFTALGRLREEIIARGGGATIFFKAGAHDPHDVAYRLETRSLRRERVRFERAGFEIGLHPSYQAHAHQRYLQAERDRLAAWTGKPPRSVRQHYLRYENGTTPRLQEHAGFHIDSTLGFARDVGFRHGTCLPYRVFDLDAWQVLDIWEMPLAFMEGTLFVRLGLDPDEARCATEELLATCRRFGGVAVGLWHNVLWDEEDHPHWGDHFTATLDEARRHDACITSLQHALSGWLGTPRPWQE